MRSIWEAADEEGLEWHAPELERPHDPDTALREAYEAGLGPAFCPEPVGKLQ